MLELLLNLHLWRGTPPLDKQIIEGFGHLAFMSGIDMPRLAKEVATKLWEMCWQFIGPHQIEMDASDVKLVVRCADVAATLALFNCANQKNLKTSPRCLRFRKAGRISHWKKCIAEIR